VGGHHHRTFVMVWHLPSWKARLVENVLRGAEKATGGGLGIGEIGGVGVGGPPEINVDF